MQRLRPSSPTLPIKLEGGKDWKPPTWKEVFDAELWAKPW